MWSILLKFAMFVPERLIEAAKRIINSAKVCRSYSDLNFGVTFIGTQCIREENSPKSLSL